MFTRAKASLFKHRKVDEDTVELGIRLSSALLILGEKGNRLSSEQSVLNGLYFETLKTRYVSVLARLATSEALKICRPRNVFENAFGKIAECKLLLQDFNAPDIELHVKDMLESDDEYLQLKIQDDRYEILAKEIVDKAQGYFSGCS